MGYVAIQPSPVNTYDMWVFLLWSCWFVIYVLNDICVVGVYESLWPSAIPVFMSYTITYPCVGKVLWSWVWVGVYLGLAVRVRFSLLVNHTHTWSGGEADCGSSGVFLNRFFVRSAFKTPLSNSPHSPPSPLFSPPLYTSPLLFYPTATLMQSHDGFLPSFAFHL